MQRPTLGVHDDPAEGFAVWGGVAVVALAAAMYLEQGTSYVCGWHCVRAFELGAVGEAGLAGLATVGAGLSLAVVRDGWTPAAARVALALAGVSGLVFGWFWLSYGGIRLPVLALTATGLLGIAGVRGVRVGTDVGGEPDGS